MKKDKLNEDMELQLIDDLHHSSNWERNDPGKWRRRRRRKKTIRLSLAAVVLAGLYLTAVYSNIPFIKELRTLYIETAMSTMTHQWMATYFIPGDVIEEVMEAVYRDRESQEGLETVWNTEEENTDPAQVTETEMETEETSEEILVESEEELFYKKFPELDTESVRAHIAAHPEALENGYDHLLIEYLSTNSKMYDYNGNEICVIDAENNTYIAKLKGSDYVGKIAVVKNSAQVDLLKSNRLGSMGQTIEAFCEGSDAVVAINASRFEDPEGHGLGGVVRGSLVIDGKEYGIPYNDTGWKFFGMKYDNLFYITKQKSAVISEYRWALECIPALIVNGENVVDGSFGMGIQPRSSIGQTEDGTFVLVIVDGRQVGYSIGCTVYECARIMLKYGVVQGANLDGGSSSVMVYKGRQITQSCSGSGNGRYSPDAIIIRKASAVE